MQAEQSRTQSNADHGWVYNANLKEHCCFDKATQRWVTQSGRRFNAQGRELHQIDWEPLSSGEEIVEGEMVLIESQDEPPLSSLSDEIPGKHALVSKVEIERTREICALKRYTVQKGNRTLIEDIENEIYTIQMVPHRHIAKFFAAYKRKKSKDTTEYGLLMQPWASAGNLKQMLSRCQLTPTKTSEGNKKILTTSFGCLASVMTFLHDRKLRHKDFKPDNILVDEGRILLTDFGSVFDGSATRSMTTYTHKPDGYTPRYAAPEYITGPSRNEQSDIFAMGGVFNDIICALDTQLLYYDDNYNQKLGEIRKGLLTNVTSPYVSKSLRGTVYQMLDPDAGSRPTARQIVRQLPQEHFCTECAAEHGKGSPGNTAPAQVSPTQTPGMTAGELDGVWKQLESRARDNHLPVPPLDDAMRTAFLGSRQALQYYVARLRESWSNTLLARQQAQSPSPSQAGGQQPNAARVPQSQFQARSQHKESPNTNRAGGKISNSTKAPQSQIQAQNQHKKSSNTNQTDKKKPNVAGGSQSQIQARSQHKESSSANRAGEKKPTAHWIPQARAQNQYQDPSSSDEEDEEDEEASDETSDEDDDPRLK